MDPLRRLTLTVIGVATLAATVGGAIAAIVTIFVTKNIAKSLAKLLQENAEREVILQKRFENAREIKSRLVELDTLLDAIQHAARPYQDQTLNEQVDKNIRALRPYKVCRRLVEAVNHYASLTIGYGQAYMGPGVDVRRADDPIPSPEERPLLEKDTARRKVTNEIQKVRDEIDAWVVVM